jgi:hypothetical protein
MERSDPDPERMKTPMTDTYVTRHSTHTVLSTKNDAYPRYSTNARPTTDQAKRYSGAYSAKRGGAGTALFFLAVFAAPFGSPRDNAGRLASASIVAPTNQITPAMATGTPRKAPNRLSYTVSQFHVVLMSQKLV